MFPLIFCLQDFYLLKCLSEKRPNSTMKDNDRKETMKFQTPSIHSSKEMRDLKSVTNERMEGPTNPKQYALPSSSKLGA